MQFSGLLSHLQEQVSPLELCRSDGETAGGLQSDEEDQSPLHQGFPGGVREGEEGGLQQQDQGHCQVTGGGGLSQL